MILPKRYYSQSAFDAAKWLATFKNQRTNKRTLLQAILKEYQTLETLEQREVQKAITPGAARESLRLNSLLLEKSSPSRIFQHIVDNVSLKISADLVETYLFRLMNTGNLNAVVSLVHILLQSDTVHYKLSNQFWSVLSSKASSLGHHASASLVYHEIVNPFVNFITEGPISEENEYVPFLLLPTAIEGLALVFAQNGNHIAVDGLRLYFKRYYSNFGHKDVYQSLHIAKIESLSMAGLFNQALDAFVTLAIKYRGHMKYRNPKDAAHSLKYASIANFKKRVKHISENIPIEENFEAGPGQLIRPFQPLIKFNDYNIEGGPYWAIFDDVLSVEDLPNFKALLHDKIGELVLHSSSVVDTLLSFITKHHYSMCKFVLASLCDSGNCSQAIAVASKVPGLFPGINKEAYISSNEFSRIFKTFKHHFQSESLNELKEHHSLLMETYTLCQSLNPQSSVPSSCFRSFLNSYFFSPLADLSELTPIVESWRLNGKQFITIEKAAYDRAILLGLTTSGLSSFIRIPI